MYIIQVERFKEKIIWYVAIKNGVIEFKLSKDLADVMSLSYAQEILEKFKEGELKNRVLTGEFAFVRIMKQVYEIEKTLCITHDEVRMIINKEAI